MEDLGAEAATHIGGHDAQLVFGDAQNEGAHQQADDVRVLRGRVERVLVTGAGVFPHRDARLHRVGDEAVVHQFQRCHMGCVLERRIGGFGVGAELPIVAEVVGQIVVHLGCTRLKRLGHVHHGGQFLDVQHDGLGGGARLFKAVGHNGGDGIAHMAHLALSQNRVRRFLHDFAMLVRHLPTAGQTAHTFKILAGEDAHHTRHAFGGAGVDVVDPAMRHVGAQEVHIGLAMYVDVVGIIAGAGQKADVFAPLRACANAMILRHSGISSLGAVCAGTHPIIADYSAATAGTS